VVDPSDRVCLAIQEGRNSDKSEDDDSAELRQQHPHQHVYKWMRKTSQPHPAQKNENADDPAGRLPLHGRYEIVSRYRPLPHHKQASSKTYYMDNPPKPIVTREAFSALREYLAIMPNVTADLESIVLAKKQQQKQMDENEGQRKKRFFVVVMVCNDAHLEVLTNYVCAARAVSMPLQRVLLFAADLGTYQLGTALGLTTYYNERLFQKVPDSSSAAATDEREKTGERDFSFMTGDWARFTMSKVWVCHLMSEMGLDFVLSDVDVFPYKTDAYEYLVNNVAHTKHPNFDLYFQDDHSDLPQYAPWSANSGFFYSKNNPRTAHFWSVMLRHGDLVLRYKNDQAALTTLLSFMTGQYGLRVKVLSEESYNFPGRCHHFLWRMEPLQSFAVSHTLFLSLTLATVGYHFHKDESFMKEMMLDRVKPYLFHMNWNTDVTTKKKFSQQIGAWYISDDSKCFRSSILEDCCMSEPIPLCYYRDKPSKMASCRDYPAIESDKSFW